MRRIIWVEHVACTEQMFIQVVGRKARRKETLGRARDSWMNNSKMDRVEIGGGGVQLV